MAREKLADGVLGGGERHCPAGHGELARPEVEAYLVKRERMRVRPPLAAQVGGHLGAQLGGSEGLAHVVVGAEAVAGDCVLLGDLGGEEEDGAVKGGPNPSHELEAVEPRHHDVTEHEVKAGKVYARHARGVGDAHDLVAVA